jgi:hypothetical protein
MTAAQQAAWRKQAARQKKAWAAVADGYRRASSLLRPGDEDYERVRRCAAKAAVIAGTNPEAPARRLCLAEGPAPTARRLTGAEWDAHAEYDIGVMIERYLSQNPPPGDASFQEPFDRWAGQLRRSGQARLEELRARPLRVVPARPSRGRRKRGGHGAGRAARSSALVEHNKRDGGEA